MPRSARSARRKASVAPSFGLPQLDLILARVQLGLLMAAIVIVPLIVLPESGFVDITGNPKTTFLRMLGSLQIGVLLSRLVLSLSGANGHRFTDSVATIRASRPALAIWISIAAVGIVSVISATFSILPHQSWWGRVPASFEASEFSALMYIVFAVSTFISLREFSKNDWLWKTLAVTGVLATLVGFFQFIGTSPLGISATAGTRLTGTNGNPIFFGAMLVVLAPIMLGVLLARHQTSLPENKMWWLGAIGTASFLIAVSLLVTASRGPWLGAFAGGVVAVVTLGIYGRSKVNQLPIMVVVAGAIIGASVTILFSDSLSESTQVESETVASPARFDSVVTRNTFENRLRYWQMSVGMAIDREAIPYTKDAPTFVRLLFGYGPDMFRYSGNYFSDTANSNERLTAAHNDPMNRLAEQGFLGFIAWMSLWASVGFGALVLIRRSGHTMTNTSAWISMAIAAALSARFVEQLFGSPTPGGALVFWVLIGGLAAMLTGAANQPRAATNQKTSAEISTAKLRVPEFAVYGVMLIIAVGSVVLAWDKGVNYLFANQLASSVNKINTLPNDVVVDRLKQATKLAPDVPRYWHELAGLEITRAEATNDPLVKAAALSRAYEYDLKAHEANPMDVGGIYDLAFTAWEAGNAGRPELRQKALELYERLTIIIPAEELARERLQLLKDALAE